RMPYQNQSLVGSLISKGTTQVVQLELPAEFWRIGVGVVFRVKSDIGNKLPAGIEYRNHNAISHHTFAAVVPYPKGCKDIFLNPQGPHARMVWLDVLEDKGERLVSGAWLVSRKTGRGGLGIQGL